MLMAPHFLKALAVLALAGCGEGPARSDGVPTPPAEGGAVPAPERRIQIAMWTPTDVHMMASGRSALAVVDGCLAFSHRSGLDVLPVFPYSSTAWDPATETLTFGGETYRLGDTLRYGGGSVERGSDRLGEGERFIPSCEIETLFLVSPPLPTGGPAADE